MALGRAAAGLTLAALGLVAAGDRGGRATPRVGASGANPNVLVILADDRDARSVAVMEKLARHLSAEGTSYENAYASLPQCCPSRATLLTGQYAHNNGVRDNDAPNGGYRALDGSNALPVWLQEAGYRTGWVGRYLNEYGNPSRGGDPLEVPPGWSRWVAPVDHTEYRMYGYTLNRDGSLQTYGAGPDDYQTDVLAREAESFVRVSARNEKPFFLTVSPLAPHKEGGRLDERPGAPRNPRPAPRHLGRFENRPLPRPPSFNERRDGDKTAVVGATPRLGHTAVQHLAKLHRSRLESLLAVDDMVGRLVRALRQTGQLRETLIIYTSDQGFLLGEHHLQGKNRLYEEAVRVALVMRGPAVEAGAVDERVVGNVDLAPTILSATGAEPGLALDGYSILPTDAQAPDSERPGLLLELYDGGRFAGLRSSRHAFLDFGNRGTELYDMRRDPFQLENLATDPAQEETVRRYQRRLDRMRGCSGVGCR